VVARVKSGGLRLTDGAVLMRVSYRQAKRLWKRYQAGGVARLKHANAGRPRAAMGLPPGLSYDNVEELIEALEGPLHK
jgi:hypothetical protein